MVDVGLNFELQEPTQQFLLKTDVSEVLKSKQIIYLPKNVLILEKRGVSFIGMKHDVVL